MREAEGLGTREDLEGPGTSIFGACWILGLEGVGELDIFGGWHGLVGGVPQEVGFGDSKALIFPNLFSLPPFCV